MQFNQQDMFQNSQTVSYFTKGNEKVTKHLKVNLRDPHFGLTKPHGRWYPQGNTVDTVLLWSLTFKCFRLVLYNLCAHRSRGHFFCLYQFAKQLHWRGSLSDKYDPLIVLVCEAEQVTPSPRSSHYRIPVSVAPTQKENVCAHMIDCVFEWVILIKFPITQTSVSSMLCSLYRYTNKQT